MSWDGTGLRSSRRALLAASTAMLLSGGVSGCTVGAETPDPSDPVGTGDRSVQDEQGLLDRIVAAVRTGDAAAYRAVLGPDDPSFVVTADLIWRNLVAVAPEEFTLTASDRREPVGSDRRRLFSADVAVTETTLGWRLPGQSRASRCTVWLTLAGQGDDLRWCGATDRPAQTPGSSAVPVPLWWTEPVLVDRADSVVVIRSATVSPPSGSAWPTLARSARDQATRHLPDHRTDLAVVEVPGSRAGFTIAAGQPEAAALAAITVSAGPDPQNAPATVVLNPSTATQTAARCGLILTHELVHAVLDAPARPAPLWIEEGIADAIAFDAYPMSAEAELSRLVTGLDGRSPRLPADADFTPRAADLDQTYALAWTACRFVVEEQGGWPALARVNDQLAEDPEHAWWRTLGQSSVRDFEHAWGGWLRRRAG